MEGKVLVGPRQADSLVAQCHHQLADRVHLIQRHHLSLLLLLVDRCCVQRMGLGPLRFTVVGHGYQKSVLFLQEGVLLQLHLLLHAKVH